VDVTSFRLRLVNMTRTVVLNQMQWFILVTFKNLIPKDVMRGLGDSRHTLDLYCRRYIRITFDDVHEVLNKSLRGYLDEMVGFCVDRQIMNFSCYTMNLYIGKISVYNFFVFGPCIFIIEEGTAQRNAQINFALINLLLFKLVRHVSAT